MDTQKKENSSTPEVLMETKSVFPFSFFPDSIIITPERIDIVHRVSFFSNHVFTILVQDLLTVQVSTNLFFGSIQFEIQGYERNPEPVRHLSKKRAIEARNIMMGLITQHKQGLNSQVEPTEQLKEKLEQKGSIKTNLYKSGFGG